MTLASDGGRKYAQILKSIWRNTDWRSLTIDAQWLYQAMLSQDSINYAGVLPLTVRRWSGLAADMTRQRIESALEELESKRFVLVDWDTEEVLIRTFIRNDGLWKQPRMMQMALTQAKEIQSLNLRAGVAEELSRIAPAVAESRASGVSAQVFTELAESTTETASALVAGPEHLGLQPLNTQDSTGEASNGVGSYVRGVRDAPTPSTKQQAPECASPGYVTPDARDKSEKPPRGPAIDVDGWKLVRDTIPLSHPQAVRTDLALRAGALVKAGTPETDVRQALSLWLTKPNLGPSTLPSLVSEVIKTRDGPSATSAKPHKLRALAKLAHAEELAENHHAKRELT